MDYMPLRDWPVISVREQSFLACTVVKRGSVLFYTPLSQSLSEFKCEPIMVTSRFYPRCFRLPHRPARFICVTEECCSSAGTGILQTVRVSCLFIVSDLSSDATILAPLYTVLSFGVPFSHFYLIIMFQTYCSLSRMSWGPGLHCRLRNQSMHLQEVTVWDGVRTPPAGMMMTVQVGVC